MKANEETKPRLHFWMPDPTQFQSGGNLYNLHLTDALKEKGVSVEQTFHKNLDREFLLRKGDFLFVDTLYIDQVKQVQVEFPITKILILHHLESLYPPKGWTSKAYFDQFEKTKLEQFDAILCTSFYARQYLRDAGLKNKPCLVLPPAIGFQPNASPTDHTIIKAVVIANLIERKGIFPFLQTLAKLKNEPGLQKLELSIIGSTQLEPEYAQACLNFVKTRPELERMIHFKGGLPHSDTLSAYQEANLFISVSFMETFGMAIQEALAYGLPVLALEGGNTSNHIIEEKNGFLFRDIPALVQKLKEFCRFPEQLKHLKNNLDKHQSQQTKDWSWSAQELIRQLNL